MTGEFPSDTDPDLLIDVIFGPIHYRLLLRFAPLTRQYGELLVDQGLRGLKGRHVACSTPQRQKNRKR